MKKVILLSTSLMSLTACNPLPLGIQVIHDCEVKPPLAEIGWWKDHCNSTGGSTTINEEPPSEEPPSEEPPNLDDDPVSNPELRERTNRSGHQDGTNPSEQDHSEQNETGRDNPGFR